jgi:hypothetical protein
MYIIHYNHCLSIYPKPDFIVFKGVLIREGVEKVKTPRSEVEVVYQLDDEGETYEEFIEVLFGLGNRPSL